MIEVSRNTWLDNFEILKERGSSRKKRIDGEY